MRLIGWEAMRESTSLNQANGSTPARWQDATKLRNTAAVLPPWSLPKKVQLRRLWNYFHSRRYVQPRIMCMFAAAVPLGRVWAASLGHALQSEDCT